jgi:hypothetical protein
MFDYSFTYDDFEADLDILRKADIWIESDTTFNLTYARYKRHIIFNKNTLNQIVKLLKKGVSMDSDNIKNLLWEKVKEDVFEFSKWKINSSASSRKCTYAKKSWYKYVHQVVREYDDHYVFGYIPTGETTDFRPRTAIGYKSLEDVKKIALDYIDKEIEHLHKVKQVIVDDKELLNG